MVAAHQRSVGKKYAYLSYAGKGHSPLTCGRVTKCASRRVRADRLDAAVWNSLSELLRTPTLLPHLHDITDEQRTCLRDWYERHSAYFRVVAVREPFLEVVNLLNEQSYTVRVEVEAKRFQEGGLLFNSLVPWDGTWYWSMEGFNAIVSGLQKHGEQVSIARTVHLGLGVHGVGPGVEPRRSPWLAIGRAIGSTEAGQGSLEGGRDGFNRVEFDGLDWGEQVENPEAGGPIGPGGERSVFATQHIVDEEAAARAVVAVDNRMLVQVEIPADVGTP